MNPFAKRRLGQTDVHLSALGFGGTAIGGLYERASEAESQRLVHTAHSQGIQYFDTAPYYGHGSSERRMGAVLAGLPRDDFVLSTKVGRLLRPVAAGVRDDRRFLDEEPFEAVFDYSYDGVMRSVEASRKRLGLPRIDILLIHDVWTPDHFAAAMDGAYPALAKLRADGEVAAIGAGIGRWEMCRDFAQAGDFDCFLLANRYTLLEQGGALHTFLPLCAAKGIGVIIGGAYNSGILATGAVAGATYNYEPADAETMARVGAMERVCRDHGVPLAAAALQFPLGHPSVASVVAGMRNCDELAQNIALMGTQIPPGLWDELKDHGLLDAAAPVPGEG